MMTSGYMPRTAMIFAAGLGTRMRSHRDDIPKPLVPVAGRALIDHVLDKCVAAGVAHAVINVSHMADMITTHLAARDDLRISFSYEETPLETAGGILKAMPLLGDEPFFVINSDIGWMDGEQPALQRMVDRFDTEQMDALLLTCPYEQARGFAGPGDFVMDGQGRFRRRGEGEQQCDIFTGIWLMHPRLLADYVGQAPIPVFSLGRFFSETDAQGWVKHMRALPHDGLWLHIGDGDGVQAAERVLAAQAI